MLSQCWITYGDLILAGVSHYPPSDKFTNDGVILVSGFGQPMCDTDYFMSKLARRLLSMGLFVLQVDLFGHGDSIGEFKDVTFKKLHRSLLAAIDYAYNHINGKLYCVGRGLSAVLFTNLSADINIEGVVGFNPYCLEPSQVKEVLNNLNINESDFCDILNKSLENEKNEDIIAFFGSLGSDIENLKGFNICYKFIDELHDFDPYKNITNCNRKKLWLIPGNDESYSITRWVPSDKKPYRELDTRKDVSLPINPLWQHNIIEVAVKWIADGDCTV